MVQRSNCYQLFCRRYNGGILLQYLGESPFCDWTLAEDNPLRYRGYVYDTDLGMYYLNSRYYDPEICRFINADTFASTGQGFTGMNMFAYCLNNPVCYTDENGTDAESALAFWTTSASVLIVADGPLPIGDIIFVGGLLVCGTITIIELVKNAESAGAAADFNEELPNIEYPGDDPTVAPEGFEWKGKGKQGSKEGGYYNPKTKESLHPDLDHPEPIGPHWDYQRGRRKPQYRIKQDGSIERKTK